MQFKLNYNIEKKINNKNIIKKLFNNLDRIKLEMHLFFNSHNLNKEIECGCPCKLIPLISIGTIFGIGSFVSQSFVNLYLRKDSIFKDALLTASIVELILYSLYKIINYGVQFKQYKEYKKIINENLIKKEQLNNYIIEYLATNNTTLSSNITIQYIKENLENLNTNELLIISILYKSTKNKILSKSQFDKTIQLLDKF